MDSYYFNHRDNHDPERDEDGHIVHMRYYGPYDNEDEAAAFFAVHSNIAGRQARLRVSQISDDIKQYMIDNPGEAIGAKKISFLHPSEAGYYGRTYEEWKQIFDREGYGWMLS